MINLCSNYPLEIKDELAEYDMKLCEYFGVNRDPQQTKVHMHTIHVHYTCTSSVYDWSSVYF